MNETVMPSWQALKSCDAPAGASEDEQYALKSLNLISHGHSRKHFTRLRLQTRALEEERRLCYVAMTRARERLFLSFVNNSRYSIPLVLSCVVLLVSHHHSSQGRRSSLGVPVCAGDP
jgi:superfamily I DNA/RNA helicase